MIKFSFLKIIPKKYQKNLISLTLCLFFSSIVEIIGISLIPLFISFVIDPNILLQNDKLNFLNNFLENYSDLKIAITGSILICILFVFKNIFIAFCIFYEANFIKNIKLYNSRKIFEYYIFNSYKFLLDKNPSLIVRTVTTDVEQAVNYLKNISLLIKEGLVLTLIIFLLLLTNTSITIITFFSLGLFSFIFFSLIKKNLKKRGQLNLEYGSRLIKIINQTFNAIKDVKLYSKEIFLTNLHQKNYTVIQKNYLVNFVLTSLPKLFLEVLVVILIVGMIIFLYLQQGNIINSIPLITLMTIASIRLMPSFNSITKSLSSMKYNLASLNSLLTILDNANIPNISEIKNNNPLKKNVSFDHSIELKNVSFSYSNNNIKILDNLNLKIKKNSKIALIGKSGSGKTTIVDLIIGLLYPTSGQILVDGKDNKKEISLLNTGYIPQNFYLFDDTIKNNVAFGIPENLIEIDKVKKALEFAKLDEFVENLEDKYETQIGNQGIKLSGGQKQRIIIARSAYYNPEILILDEATSAIDEEIEREFINNLIKISKNKTLIIISHRSSTIESCDEVYKLENKKLLKIK